jgi:hypothetical protein
MKRSAFAPDLFPVGLGFLGAVLLVFPSLRVAGALALMLAAAYWLLMSVLRLTQRNR